jgi:hypothetical protein
MPTHRHLVGRITEGLLLIVMAAACSRSGPQLNIEIDNTGGPKEVTVTIDSSNPRMTGGEEVKVLLGEGAAWSVPLGSTWEVRVDGKHVIGSGDRTDPAPPSSGQRQDVSIPMRVAADGTVILLDGPQVAPATQPGPRG